jgi:hypothetical protein
MAAEITDAELASFVGNIARQFTQSVTHNVPPSDRRSLTKSSLDPRQFMAKNGRNRAAYQQQRPQQPLQQRPQQPYYPPQQQQPYYPQQQQPYYPDQQYYPPQESFADPSELAGRRLQPNIQTVPLPPIVEKYLHEKGALPQQNGQQNYPQPTQQYVPEPQTAVEDDGQQDLFVGSEMKPYNASPQIFTIKSAKNKQKNTVWGRKSMRNVLWYLRKIYKLLQSIDQKLDVKENTIAPTTNQLHKVHNNNKKRN